ncbi:hypothetical protein C8R42DRAFT_686363 [Lentinula raphanica]|nr:hypothetical protein C8R42DRAFT_686363 [Lentinula raphanica]
MIFKLAWVMGRVEYTSDALRMQIIRFSFHEQSNLAGLDRVMSTSKWFFSSLSPGSRLHCLPTRGRRSTFLFTSLEWVGKALYRSSSINILEEIVTRHQPSSLKNHRNPHSRVLSSRAVLPWFHVAK